MVYTLWWGFFISLAVSLAAGKPLIGALKKFRARQSERPEGPAGHKSKEGTPTMGGLLILGAVVLAMALCRVLFGEGDWRQGSVLFLFLGHGAIGFLDDRTKAVKKRNLGLTALQKIVCQIIMAVIFCFLLHTVLHVPTTLWIPGTTLHVNLGYAYYVVVFLMLVGTGNAVNLTDGLDGLAAGSCAITFAAYGVIAIALGYIHFSLLSAVLTGACLGFLFFNQHPARMFMGDTGSLALGGALAGMAILTKTELLLLLIGALYVIETLSVILQVLSFKTRGVRIFKMSPIHHHFELSGWSEVKVVTVFWIFSAIMAVLSIFVVWSCR